MRSRLAGAHFRWRDGSVTARGKIISDNVVDHLGGAGAFATAQDFASVLLLLINEGKHRTCLIFSPFPFPLLFLLHHLTALRSCNRKPSPPTIHNSRDAQSATLTIPSQMARHAYARKPE